VALARGLDKVKIQPRDIQPRDIQPRDIQPRNIQPRDIQLRNIQLRNDLTRRAENMRGPRCLVVAEARADGDLVASLGTPAAEHGCTRLGLHAGKEPVGLGAVAAVGLEGTLRHLTRLLLNFFAVGNSPSVYLKACAIPKSGAKERS